MDRLCFLSKNLYNATLYGSRRSYFDRRRKGYRVLRKQFQDENQPDYRALPAKVARQTMMLVDRNFRSFFALNDMEPPPDPRPRIPGYLHRRKGRQAVIYTRQAISFREKGFVGLSGTGIRIPASIDPERINQVRLVPWVDHIQAEIVYTVTRPRPMADNSEY
ncbi:MAG: transposase, partial [Deltaproteobacteria bacterium]|nr:transposase [Deltaproteobacteria bacterium]